MFHASECFLFHWNSLWFVFNFRDSLIVSISNISTSIFAGFVIFSIVGYLAKELGKDVGEVVDQGRYKHFY